MFGIDDVISAVSKLVDDVVQTAFPTPEAKASVEAMAIQAQADALVATTQVQLSAIMAEASSGDKWTSRARPSFFYVFYVLILMAVPMAFVFAFAPDAGERIALGMQQWLAAIPQPMWDLFQAGFLGYTASRGVEKIIPHVARIIKG
jgi:hypothetical protein